MEKSLVEASTGDQERDPGRVEYARSSLLTESPHGCQNTGGLLVSITRELKK